MSIDKNVLPLLTLALLVSWTASASAQDQPAGGGEAPPSAPAAPNGPDNGAPAPAPAPAAPVSGTPTIVGGIAPPPPGVPIGGGNNTESSAQPVSGDKEDHFDYGGGGGSGNTVHGSKGGYAYLGGSRSESIGGGVLPRVHVVRRGDTLWGICDQYFQNPYQWPRIWSYNPQLQNPHWIYPGDQIRLQVGAGAATVSNLGGAHDNLFEHHRTVLPETIFLRDEGYVEDEAKENWGELTGAPEERIFLTDGDEVYMHIAKDRDLKIGDELTIYRPTRALGSGQIVQIQGTVHIDDWDDKSRVARGRIVESLDTIERGARIGPVGRRFDVVPPVRNDADVTAQVIASVKLHAFFGQNQVVFVNKGADDGLKVGNRLFVMRRGDAWRQTLVTDTSALRISVESASPAEMEHVPRTRDESKYPQEVTAELRVLSLHQHSATCLVTQSVHEIELDELAIARKGY
jgi:LysM domain